MPYTPYVRPVRPTTVAGGAGGSTPTTPSYGQQQDDPAKQQQQSQVQRYVQPVGAGPQQTQQTAQKKPTSQPGANPWAQWGMDPTKPVPAGMSGTREQALQGLGYAAHSILGAPLTEQQWNDMASAIGDTGGNPTSDLYNKALSWINGQKTAAPAGAGGGIVPVPGHYADGIDPLPQTPWGVTPPAPYKPSAPPPEPIPYAPPAPYTPQVKPQFAQYQGPDQSAQDSQMSTLISQLLGHPETLDEDTINQLKMKSKEQAMSQSEQLRQQAMADRSARGWTEQGGFAAATDEALDHDLINSLITSNRDIDIAAKATNRADMLKALDTAGTALSNQSGRSTDAYRNTLAGQGAQADSDYRIDNANDDARRFDYTVGEDSRRSDNDFDLRRYLAGEGLQQNAAASEMGNAEFVFNQQDANRAKTLQEWLATQGVNMDMGKFAETVHQFKTATGLDLLKILEQQREFDGSMGENQRQFNNTLGFNYTNLGLNQQNSMLGSLMEYLKS